MVFLFFGHPGAGKTTLCHRFGALNGLPALDTDQFMTAEERAAAAGGWYTEAMRQANIRRYAAHVRSGAAGGPHIALADGLPTDSARRVARAEWPAGAVVFVLVETPPDLWEQRLAARGENPVAITVAGARAYIRDHWQPIAPDFPHERIANGPDAAATDAHLRALFRRHVGGDA